MDAERSQKEWNHMNAYDVFEKNTMLEDKMKRNRLHINY